MFTRISFKRISYMTRIANPRMGRAVMMTENATLNAIDISLSFSWLSSSRCHQTHERKRQKGKKWLACDSRAKGKEVIVQLAEEGKFVGTSVIGPKEEGAIEVGNPAYSLYSCTEIARARTYTGILALRSSSVDSQAKPSWSKQLFEFTTYSCAADLKNKRFVNNTF